MAWDDRFQSESDLPVRIASLLDNIRDWQTPEEVIEAHYPPRFCMNSTMTAIRS